MRDYAKVSPRFWIGETGKQIRSCGVEAQVLAMYLMSSPHSNMLGLYWVPLAYIAHETGLPLKGASKALRSLCEVGFCAYDEAAEVVWVIEMARFQIADKLSPKDNQVKGLQSTYEELPENRFLGEFFDRYSEAFCMTHRRGSKGASKPLRSQEQEQEQEQEGYGPPDSGQSDPPKVDPKEADKPVTAETWKAYSEAYAAEYGAQPIRNAKVNGQLRQLVDRLGADKAPLVAEFFVKSKNDYYAKRLHPVDLLLSDAEKLHTEWATGRVATAAKSLPNRDFLR